MRAFLFLLLFLLDVALLLRPVAAAGLTPNLTLSQGLVRHLTPARLRVLDGEFVQLHVGYPGKDVALHVRWDLAYVGLFAQLDLAGSSRSLAAVDNSDLFCLGPECVRLPFVLLGGEPDGAPAQLALSGHHGVLGLAPGSPVRTAFPWVRYMGALLELLPSAPAPGPGAVRPVAGPALFAARLNHRPAWLELRLDRGYTLVPPDATDRGLTLDLVRLAGPDRPQTQSQSASPALAKRALRLDLRPDAEHIHAPDNTRIPVMRQAPPYFEQQPALSALGWNASARVELGRLMAQGLLRTVVGPDGAVLWVEPESAHVPRLGRLDYMPFVLPLLMLLLLWQLGMHEDVLAAEHAAAVDVEPPRRDVVFVLDAAGARRSVVPRDLIPVPRLPPGVARQWEPNSLLAFRHPGIGRWLLPGLTALVAALLAGSALLGYGGLRAFRASDNSALDAAAVYSAGAMMLVLSAGAWTLYTQPSTAVVYGTCVPLLGLWLLAMLEPYTIVTGAVLLMASGVVCVHTMYLLLASLLAGLWPGVAYGNTLPVRVRPERSLALYAFWLLLNAALAAWAALLFACYTVPMLIVEWRPAHPAAYWAGALAFALAVVVAADLFYSRQLAMLRSQALGLVRVRRLATLTGEHVTAVEAGGGRVAL